MVRRKARKIKLGTGLLALVAFGISGGVEGSTHSRAEQSPPPPVAAPPSVGLAVTLLGSSEGVDFAPFIKTLVVAVKPPLYAKLTESGAQGQRAIVALRFRVLKDGTIQNGMVTIDRSSRRDDIDQSALAAIRAARSIQPSA